MNLYISDTHFGHRDIIGFDHRPFRDVYEMDETLIWLWNERVSKDDNIWIVGDFCCGGDKPPEYYLRQLKGRKHLVIGNHDKSLINNPKACSYLESIQETAMITDTYKGQVVSVLMQHYPITEWESTDASQYHIYGHIHNWKNNENEIMRGKDKAFNAGCMVNGYTPVSLWGLVENKRKLMNSCM